MITDKKMDPAGKASWKCVQLHIGTTATSQTDKRTHAITPGFDFEIMAAEFYCLTRPNAGFSTKIRVGTTDAVTAVSDPTADTPTAATLSTTLANRRGTTTGILNCVYTSDADGAATNGIWTVWIRPRPLNGEIRL